MRWRRRTLAGSGALVGVVVPVYDVAAYLPECLDSVLSSTHRSLDVLVVDDGSTDRSGEIAEAYAARDPRVRVLHTANLGLGAARNAGLAEVRGDLVTFADSDDAVPPGAYTAMLTALEASGSDFVTGSLLRWAGPELSEPRWMHRLHNPRRSGIRAGEHPEILGDVFAWNKLFRRDWWDEQGLVFAEGVHYEDQPATTEAYLAGTFDVLPTPVYHWRTRRDGTSITQQRGSLRDLEDRWATKRRALAAVTASEQSALVLPVFLDRVLAGDLWRYFQHIPDCDDAWWDLLVAGVHEMWGGRSLVSSGLPPVHRLAGWLVEQERREEAAAVMTWASGLGGPAPRITTPDGVLIDVPVLAPGSVLPHVLAVRPHEV